MRRLLPVLLPAVLWFPVTVPAVDDAVKEIGKGALDAAFSEAEKRIIDRYYGDRLRRQARTEQAGDENEYGEADADRPAKKDRKHKKRGKGKGAGPAVAGQGGLPPGIRKKLERGGELPPGIAKRQLPGDLEAELPPAPEGYERAVVDDKVVLIDAATGVIKDIFRPSSERTDAMAGKRMRTRTEAAGSADTGSAPASESSAAKRWWEFWK